MSAQLVQDLINLTGVKGPHRHTLFDFVLGTIDAMQRNGDELDEILLPQEAFIDIRQAQASMQAHQRGGPHSRDNHLRAGRIDIEVHPFPEILLKARRDQMLNAKLPWPVPEETVATKRQVHHTVRVALEKYCAHKRSPWFTKKALATWAGLSTEDVDDYIRMEETGTMSDVWHNSGSKWHIHWPSRMMYDTQLEGAAFDEEAANATLPTSPRYRVAFDRLKLPRVKAKPPEASFYSSQLGMPYQVAKVTL